MKQSTASLTTAQQAIIRTLPLGVNATLSWNEARIVRILGTMQPQTMLSAIRDLQVRHDVLTVHIRDGALAPSVPDSIAIQNHPIRKLPPVEREEMLPQYMHSLVAETFDSVKGSLFRTVVISLQSGEPVIGFAANHVICDGWSFRILREELAAVYLAHAQGHPTENDLPPAPGFLQFASEQKEAPSPPQPEVELASWKAVFSELWPTLDLLTDQPRGALRSYTALRQDRRLNPELIAQLRAAAGRRGPSHFGILCTAYGALVARLSGSTDVAIAIHAAALFDEGLERLAGHCASHLPRRLAEVVDAKTGELLTAIQHAILDDCGHKCFGQELLLERFGSPFDQGCLPMARGKFGLNHSLECVARARHRKKMQKRMSDDGAIQGSKYLCSRSARTVIASVERGEFVEMMSPKHPPISSTELTMGLHL